MNYGGTVMTTIQNAGNQTAGASNGQAQELKPWSAPQLAVVSIAGLTEQMLSPGKDAFASTSTLS
jgi:hypothetical protein